MFEIHDKRVAQKLALTKLRLIEMGIPEEKIHLHTLRVLTPVENNISYYESSLIQGVDNIKPGEVLLTKQDAFGFVGLREIVAKAKGPKTNYMVNGVPFFQYIDPTVFPGAAAGSAAAGGVGSSAYYEAEGMKNLFTGYVELKESSREIVHELDTRQLRYMPSRAIGVAGEMPSVKALQVTESINESNGTFLPEKEILISGSKNINVIFNIKGKSNLSQIESPFADEETNLFGFELIGFLIRGGADVACIKSATRDGWADLCLEEVTAAAA